MEGQKLLGPVLVGFVVGEGKLRKSTKRDKMTKMEVFEKACIFGFKGDFSLVYEIYHQNYKSIDCRTSFEENIEYDNTTIDIESTLLLVRGISSAY